jgi:hypothetical protein
MITTIITIASAILVTGSIIVCAMVAAEWRREQSIREFFKHRDAEWRERRDHQ